MAEYVLESTRSTIVSLESIRRKGHGLDARRSSMLSRVSSSGDWGKFNLDSIEIIDLAYLTVKTGDEFALLRGKRSDILFHGNPTNCHFDDEIVDFLREKRYDLIAHSHPAEDRPVPSKSDRQMLHTINQHQSQIISATTGKITVFTENEFDDLSYF